MKGQRRGEKGGRGGESNNATRKREMNKGRGGEIEGK